MFDVEDMLEAAQADDWMTDDEIAALEAWEGGEDLREGSPMFSEDGNRWEFY